VSLKNNPVLIALSEGRLPDERPNYEYFAQILSLNEQVQFRPRRCWIFVSHEDVVVGEDGTGHLPTTGGKLGPSEYPHLPRNLERDTWAKEEQQFFRGSLLHEFTKELQQVGSSSVRELSKEWESAFPDLHQRLEAITSTTTDARCDVLHMHATLELKEKSRFPSGSNLSSWVEINIEQPRLLSHRWKVETRLVRPPELGYSHGELRSDAAPEVIYESSKREFTIPYQHRPGCDGPRHDGRTPCDCLAQRCRRDGVTVPFPVPFPADVWAQTLTSCAEYAAHNFSGMKKHDRDQGAATRARDDRDGPRSRRRTKQPTQMDLVPKIAMMQEIFSCPPASSDREEGGDSGSQRWTRRAVILWTFQTIHSIDAEGRPVTAPCGKTNWRFLTILDPVSESHQRHAIVRGRRASGDGHREAPKASNSLACGSPRPVSREAIMSPDPTYQQHLSAGMSENFTSAWDSPAGLSSLPGSGAHAVYNAHFMPQTVATHHTATEAAYGLLDSFSSHSGLTTPPPTASLASTFAQAFDTSSAGSDIMPNYMTTHVAVTAAGMDGSSHPLTGSLSAMTDPFLSHVGATYGETHDGAHGYGHDIGGGLDSGAPWSSGGYPGSSGAQPHRGLLSWAPGLHPRSVSSRRGSGQQYHHRQHRQPHPRHQQEEWASTTGAANNNMDDHDSSWATITTTTPDILGEEVTTTNNNHINSALTATITRADHSHDQDYNDKPHHGDYHQIHTSNDSAAQEASQEDWEHIHHIHHPHASSSSFSGTPTPTTSLSSSDNSDDRNHLSQDDWEVIVHPLPGTGTADGEREAEEADGKSAAKREERYPPQMMMRGLKRSRPDEDEDGLGEDDDGGDGGDGGDCGDGDEYRRLRVRTSLG
jgi:hypothetical protein